MQTGMRQPPPHRLAWTLGNLLMLAGIFLLLYVGGVYADEAYSRLAARGDNDLPVPAAAPPAAAAPTAPAFQAPDLSASADLPASQRVAAAAPVTRIAIPSIEVDSKVIEVGWTLVRDEAAGADVAVWDVAKFAVGHHQGTARPGEGGNIVMAGHVGGAGPVFARLIEVAPGAQITLYSGGQQYLYVVRDVLRVQEVGVTNEERIANAAYMDPTESELVTLITCWPATGPNAFDQRIVVRAVPFGGASSEATTSNWVMR